MAITYKKKLVLIGLMVLISGVGLYMVISTDEIKNSRVDFKVVDNSTGKYIVTYDPMTGQPHVSIRPEAP